MRDNQTNLLNSTDEPSPGSSRLHNFFTSLALSALFNNNSKEPQDPSNALDLTKCSLDLPSTPATAQLATPMMSHLQAPASPFQTAFNFDPFYVRELMGAQLTASLSAPPSAPPSAPLSAPPSAPLSAPPSAALPTPLSAALSPPLSSSCPQFYEAQRHLPSGSLRPLGSPIHLKKRYSELQYRVLKDYYRRNRYVNQREMVEIGRKTGLTRQQVKIWFQNRRHTDKKRHG